MKNLLLRMAYYNLFGIAAGCVIELGDGSYTRLQKMGLRLAFIACVDTGLWCWMRSRSAPVPECT